MKLYVRTMRDKFGARQNILFTDESGLAKPLGVFDEYAISEFIDMYHQEQAEMDKAIASIKEDDK